MKAHLLALVLAGAPFLAAQTYTDDQLYRMGYDAWQRTECVKVGEYFFALLQRNGLVVRDSSMRDQLQQAIDWCAGHTTVYAGSKGDNPGAGRGSTLVKPPLAIAMPPSVRRSSPVQKRCDIYATLAVAQAGANTANQCNYTGNRWEGRYQFHYDYCLTAPAADVHSETQARQELLRQCAP